MPPECKGDVTVDCKFSAGVKVKASKSDAPPRSHRVSSTLAKDWTLWAGDCSDPTGQQKRSREVRRAMLPAVSHCL